MCVCPLSSFSKRLIPRRGMKTPSQIAMAIIQSIHVDHVAIGDVEVNVVVAAVVVVMVVY